MCFAVEKYLLNGEALTSLQPLPESGMTLRLLHGIKDKMMEIFHGNKDKKKMALLTIRLNPPRLFYFMARNRHMCPLNATCLMAGQNV